ncbi:MAG: hypothetical protein U9N76_00355 [Candidatus Marinimicrobia bacterium]|nr:hypothetical protein [Candidatus Neomarinimicrobiota bacterium]
MKINNKKTFILIIVFGFIINLSANFGMPGLSLPNDIVSGYNYNLVSILKQNEIKQNSFYTAYSPWMYDTKYSVINYNFDKGFIGFRGLLSDGIEIRGEQPSDDPVGETQYYNFAFGGGKFFKKDKMTVGISADILFEKLYYETSWGFELSSIFKYKISEIINPYVGFENLGMMNNLSNQSTSLPTKYYLGNELKLKSIHLGTSMGMDNELEMFYRLDVHYLNKIGNLSVGYSSYESVFHYGIQVFIKNYSIGFGQFIYTDELKSPFMFSVAF